MNYRCLQKHSFRHGDYEIVPIRHEDIFKIMKWRNEQLHILRQDHILTEEEQENYYRNVIVPSFSQEKPKQILFSFLEKGVCIGYGGLVHIDWESRRGEVSFLMETERSKDEAKYRKDFTDFLSLIKQVAKDLRFHRLHSELFDIRPLHQELLESLGFQREGRMKEHIFVHGQYVDSIIHGCVLNYDA